MSLIHVELFGQRESEYAFRKKVNYRFFVEKLAIDRLFKLTEKLTLVR